MEHRSEPVWQHKGLHNQKVMASLKEAVIERRFWPRWCSLHNQKVMASLKDECDQPVEPLPSRLHNQKVMASLKEVSERNFYSP